MAEPRPAGVSHFISLSVSPVYPKSFDITAAADHSFYGHFSVEELKEAWRKKAAEVAKGRKFKISSLVVHDNETDIGGGAAKTRRGFRANKLIDLQKTAIAPITPSTSRSGLRPPPARGGLPPP